MDILVVLLLLLVVVVYHVEQIRYFKEMETKMAHLDELIKKKNSPVYRDLRFVSPNEWQRKKSYL